MSNFIYKIDYNIAKNFHKLYSIFGKFANATMEGVSLIAEVGILFLLIGLGLSIFKRTRKIGGTILLSVALGFLITNIVLKPIIERARPFSNISSDFYKWWLDAGAIKESGYSFPSGHTTATTAFSVAIFLTTNKKYSCYILLLPLLMASSRIYLMVHYFSDCVGGIVVGTVSALIAWIILKLIYSSKIKLFTWIREFDVFNVKKKKVVSAQTNNTETTIEETVYQPLNQESEENNKTLIQNLLDDKDDSKNNK